MKAHWMLFLLVAGLTLSAVQGIDEHQHHQHGAKGEPKEPPPRVFLDKSPRIVAYQLKRLSNRRLLQVVRKTDDAKYKPVYEAILLRDGMSPQNREEAVQAIAVLDKTNPIAVLFEAMDGLDGEDRLERRVTRQLAQMVLSMSPQELEPHLDIFKQASESENPTTRSAGYAALMAAGQAKQAWELATDDDAKLDVLGAVVLTRKQPLRNSQRGEIAALVSKGNKPAVRKAAIAALGFLSSQQEATFQLVAPYLSNDQFRDAVVATCLKIPPAKREPKMAAKMAAFLVDYAEATPAERRVDDNFTDAMQLADQLLAKLPVAQAKAFRTRLRAVTVRVVKIHTIEEEMRYDTPYFAVEAGRPAQILLINDDLMPHNLVITAPGALKEVAEAGAQVGPTTEVSGKQYVPKSDKVLFATKMVPSFSQERLTFTAPSEPGEYPFVCTFPRHWMRMYGVMVVVEDLDAWAQNPTKPKDPTGNNRSFVKNWTLDDLKGEIADGLRGRSASIGEKVFAEATCAQCHKVSGKGGAVGPELTGVLERWKGDHAGVLREILEPSHKVDQKYAVKIVITDDGKVVSGVVVKDDKESISVVANPEDPKPIEIPKDTIDEIVQSPKSLMPKALLDRFTKDEIFELLAYITTAKPAQP